MNSKPRAAELPSLTAVRAFAAGCVLLWHMRSLHLGGLAYPMFNSLQSGVAVFFVLSGFILAWTYRPESYCKFWQRRAARVLPAHWIAMAVCAAMAVAQGVREDLWRTIPAWLLVQSWVPDPQFFYAGNAVSWSLACEAFFYLLFPMLLPLVVKAGRRGRIWIVVAATTFAATLQTTVYLLAGGAAVADDLSQAQWLIYTFPLARLPEFLVGICFGVMYREGEVAEVLWWQSVPLLLTVLYIAGTFESCTAATWLVMVPMALVLVSLADLDVRGKRSFLNSAPVQYAGRISYCVYLSQLMFLGTLARILGDETTTNVLALVLALLFAVALHHAVEVPGARVFRPRTRPSLAW